MNDSLYISDEDSQYYSDTDPEFENATPAVLSNDVFVIPNSEARTLKNIDSLHRVLRSKEDGVIRPKSGRIIPTNIIILGENNFTIRLCVDPLQQHWMDKEVNSNLTVKQVSVSPFFRGRVKISLYNNSMNTLRIPQNTALAVMTSKNYDM